MPFELLMRAEVGKYYNDAIMAFMERGALIYIGKQWGRKKEVCLCASAYCLQSGSTYIYGWLNSHPDV